MRNLQTMSAGKLLQGPSMLHMLELHVFKLI